MKNIFLPCQRGIILQGIEQNPGRELSNEMIQRLPRAGTHSCSVAEVNEQTARLENRGCIRAVRMGDPAGLDDAAPDIIKRKIPGI